MDHFQHHHHNVEADRAKSGSAFDCDRNYRSARFPPGAAFVACFLLSPFAWGGIIWGVMALCR